jgi:hypothetical protein
MVLGGEGCEGFDLQNKTFQTKYYFFYFFIFYFKIFFFGGQTLHTLHIPFSEKLI